MSIAISAEKILVKGIPYRRIQSIVALKKSQLPTQYLESQPRCYVVQDKAQNNELRIMQGRSTWKK